MIAWFAWARLNKLEGLPDFPEQDNQSYFGKSGTPSKPDRFSSANHATVPAWSLLVRLIRLWQLKPIDQRKTTSNAKTAGQAKIITSAKTCQAKATDQEKEAGQEKTHVMKPA